MHILILISVCAQLYFAYHAYKTGKDAWWLLVILGLPVIGVIAYLVAEAYGDVSVAYDLEQAKDGVFSETETYADIRKLREDVELSDTAYNRQMLARGYLQMKRYPEAVEEYRKVLDIDVREDPSVLLELSFAQLMDGVARDSINTLARLAQVHPDYEPYRRDLILARAREAAGDTEEAFKAYAKLLETCPGEEVPCRYALLLQKAGREGECQKLLEEMRQRVRRSSKLYRKEQKKWIDLAKKAYKG